MSATTSGPTGAKPEKPSFAKIAASGLKQTAAPHSSTNSAIINQQNTSSPQASGITVTPSREGTQLTGSPSTAKKSETPSAKEPKEMSTPAADKPTVQVQPVDSLPRRPDEPAPEGLLMPGTTEDAGTQISSSSDSNKPPSLDGKSVASGTTYALDEKESLRPDDSASVKGVEDEDVQSPPDSSDAGPRLGSADDARAFQEQLREISLMEPSPRPRVFGSAPKGVLYVPPEGSGVGVVPNSARTAGSPSLPIESPPDQKLLDALEHPQDRIWVLKLEQDVIDFVRNASESALMLPSCHSFYRLLAHKMADYYRLDHFVDDSVNAVCLYKTPHCRIAPPLTGIATPSTAASTPPPAAPRMKILRRGDKDGPGNGSNMTSENGDDSNEDDKKSKVPLTREEREARYDAARARIWQSTDSPPGSQKEIQDSRSSSAAGKKNKKKARAIADDDFEARSAYSNIYAPSFGEGGISSMPYNTFGLVGQPGGQYPPAAYTPQTAGAMQQAPVHNPGHGAWAHPQHQPVESSRQWQQASYPAYDLSNEFQRSMSFQAQSPAQSPTTTFPVHYPQQYFSPQQYWPQQQYEVGPQGPHPAYGFPSNFPPSQHQTHKQSYPYGQLPSQAFPGRPKSHAEHPIPGSYKSRHFNPQSQAFVPGQGESTGHRPFSPLAAPGSNNGFNSAYASPAQLQRQASSQSHASSYGASHQKSPAPVQTRGSGQQHMTHPLPQPVFPLQPSPNVPLPPKPTTSAPQQPSETRLTSSTSTAAAALSRPQHQSVTAKWGTPASLPAKPPPPATDAPQIVRSPAASTAPVAHQSSAGSVGHFPTFGSMPSVQIVNGSGVPAQQGKRS